MHEARIVVASDRFAIRSPEPAIECFAIKVAGTGDLLATLRS